MSNLLLLVYVCLRATLKERRDLTPPFTVVSQYEALRDGNPSYAARSVGVIQTSKLKPTTGPSTSKAGTNKRQLKSSPLLFRQQHS